jgi:hypothetical protein
LTAVDVRHRDVLDAVDLTDVVNANDVLVGDLPREQQLALEAPLDVGGDGLVGHRFRTNHLDGDGDAELGIPGLIHRSHAACSEQADDVIARTEWLPGLERQAAIVQRSAPFEPGGGRRRNRRHRYAADNGRRSIGVRPQRARVECNRRREISEGCSANRAMACAGRGGRPALRAIHVRMGSARRS